MLIISATLLGLVTPPLERAARATVVLEMDLNGLVGRADQIIIGTVKGSTSRWTKNRRYIVTDTVVEVRETIFGTPQKQVIVRRLGGTVGDLGMRVAGSAELEPETTVLLFIQQRDGHKYVVGMRQGAMLLQKDGKGEEIVVQSYGNVAVARRSPTGNGLQLYSAHAPESHALSSFRDRIRDAIKRCKKNPSRCH